MLTVGKLLSYLENHNEKSLVKIYDATFKEICHADSVFEKRNPDTDLMDVVIKIKSD